MAHVKSRLLTSWLRLEYATQMRFATIETRTQKKRLQLIKEDANDYLAQHHKPKQRESFFRPWLLLRDADI